MPVQQLSGVTVVIIIAICVEVFFVVLIFARRQIMRFGLRNRRGPHTYVGHGGPKLLRRDIDRGLDYIPYIKYEPPLSLSKTDNDDVNRHHSIYRIQALEAYRTFERDLSQLFPNFIRLPGTSVRTFLTNCCGSNGPLTKVDNKLVQRICDDYSDARHHYEEFGPDRFKTFESRLDCLNKELYRHLKSPNLSKRKSHQPSSHVQKESSAYIVDSNMLSISTAV